MIRLRVSIVVTIVVVIVGGSIFAGFGYLSNQKLGETIELPEIKDQYQNLENYKLELEKINQNNQRILKDLEEQITDSENPNLAQINEEIEAVKRVISENKKDLERVIEELSRLGNDQ